MEEETRTAAEQVEAKMKDMAERHVVNTCSEQIWHTPECDGNCEEKALLPSEVAINEEIKKWNEVGMDLSGIPVDALHLEVAQGALIDYLVEKGLADRAELDEKYRQKFVERLRVVREANQDQVIEARRRAQIAVPGAQVMPDIVLPAQRRQKMQ